MAEAAFHLICGSTGAGKSTYAQALASDLGGLHFAIDRWMVTLFWQDSPQPIEFDWTMARIDRCEAMIFETAKQAVSIGVPAILDLGFTKSAHRQKFAKLMKGIGVQHIGVADTIGTGTPRATQAAMEAALAHYALENVSGHFHDTYGQALANIYACLQMGVASFDTSVAGLGGCPYAKGATGNVATEDVLYLLRGLGIDTGIDFEQVVAIGQWISGILGRKAFARAGNALAARSAAAAAA